MEFLTTGDGLRHQFAFVAGFGRDAVGNVGSIVGHDAISFFDVEEQEIPLASMALPVVI